MNGHQAIIAMRHGGYKPAYVWLQDAEIALGTNAVTLAKTDIPEALDLRFLIGTTVLAESPDKQRLERITRACVQAKAARVIASLYDPKRWFQTTEITDTDGVMTWQK